MKQNEVLSEKEILDVILREYDGILIKEKCVDGKITTSVDTETLIRDIKILLRCSKDSSIEKDLRLLSVLCLQNIIKRYSISYILRINNKK